MPPLPHQHPADKPSELLSIAIVGNDALIEALPARPIQFAHACRAAGFDLVLPESWGDELVADAALRTLEERNGDPAVFCACPLVRERLLAAGADLAPMLITTVAPSIAAARYARALYGDRLGHLAYIGDCPAASGPEFDVHYPTSAFLAVLGSRGINALEQPIVFDAVLPPDRRRFISLPGGCPSPEALWTRGHERSLVGIESDDLTIELAQQLLVRESVLVDLAASLGCACSGVTPTTPGRSARVAVMSLEPPRTSTPVIEPGVVESLDDPVDPAALVPRPPIGVRAGETSTVPSVEWRSPIREGAGERKAHGARSPIAITPAGALSAMRPAARQATAARGASALLAGSVPETPARQTAAPAELGADAPAPHLTIEPAPVPSAPPVAPATHRAPPAAPASLRPPGRALPAVPRSSIGSFSAARTLEPSPIRLPRAYMPRRPLAGRHLAPTPPTTPTPPTPPTPAARAAHESPSPDGHSRSEQEAPVTPAVVASRIPVEEPKAARGIHGARAAREVSDTISNAERREPSHPSPTPQVSAEVAQGASRRRAIVLGTLIWLAVLAVVAVIIRRLVV